MSKGDLRVHVLVAKNESEFGMQVFIKYKHLVYGLWMDSFLKWPCTGIPQTVIKSAIKSVFVYVQENKRLFSCSGAIITAVAESVVVCVMWVIAIIVTD